MKNKLKILTILLLGIGILSAQYNSEFKKGYIRGYKEGYCYNKGYGCIKPLDPIPPLPEIGEKTYTDGYNKGFISGQYEQNNINNQDCVGGNAYSCDKPRKVLETGVDMKYAYEMALRKEAQNRQYYNELANQTRRDYQYYEKIIADYDALIEGLKSQTVYSSTLDVLYRELVYYDPEIIYNQCPKSIGSYNDLDWCANKMEDNYKKIQKVAQLAQKEYDLFNSNKNMIIKGRYHFGGYKDYKYNSATKQYEVVKTNEETSYIEFGENSIVFKKGAKGKVKQSYLRYWGFKEQNYLFYDGWGQLLVVSPDLKSIHWYYDETNERYYKKTHFFK